MPARCALIDDRRSFRLAHVFATIEDRAARLSIGQSGGKDRRRGSAAETAALTRDDILLPENALISAYGFSTHKPASHE